MKGWCSVWLSRKSENFLQKNENASFVLDESEHHRGEELVLVGSCVEGFGPVSPCALGESGLGVFGGCGLHRGFTGGLSSPSVQDGVSQRLDLLHDGVCTKGRLYSRLYSTLE